MNSIPMTTMTAAAAEAVVVTAMSATIDSTITAAATGTTTATTSTSTSSLSHLSNPAISNLTTNMMVTASTSVTAIAKEFQTPNSIRKARNGTLPIVNTPTPPSRFRPIPNPFESNINNLHLPTIDR